MRWPTELTWWGEPIYKAVKRKGKVVNVLVGWKAHGQGTRHGKSLTIMSDEVFHLTTPLEWVDWARVTRVLDARLPGPGKGMGRHPGEPRRRRRRALRRLEDRIKGWKELTAGLTPAKAASYRKPGSLSGRK